MKIIKKSKLKMGPIIKGYYIFPFVFGGIFAILTIILFFINGLAGTIGATALIVYILALLVFIALNNRKLEFSLVRFARQYGELEGELISDFPMPYVVVDPDGDLLAYNRIFARIYDEKTGIGNICNVFPQLSKKDFDFEGEEKNISLEYDNRSFRLNIKRIKVSKDLIEDRIVLLPEHNLTIFAIYMFDETEIINLMRKNVDDELVAGNIYVDNYEEILARDLEVKGNLKIALIDKAISSYFNNIEGVVRKVDNDRYFVIFKKKYLNLLQSKKFDLLDQIKELDVGSDQVLTISIGIGVADTYPKAVETASEALELALGRGGDQAILKEGERVYFYGGKTKLAEKNTRVRARIKAVALKEIFSNKERIVVMGHKNADADSFAASIGIYKVAKALGKHAYIVTDVSNQSIKAMMDTFTADEEYSKHVFITADQAINYMHNDTVLAIVDVNNPDIFGAPELVGMAKNIVLIDHHIQCAEKIDNLVYSYVEPTASSTSEMVTEILQYIGGIRIKKHEAEALYAGILIDTDYFTKNTGVRTFEAAAFLKKQGVDIQRVQDMFSEPLDTIKVKANAMGTVEEIAPGFVIAVSPGTGVKNPTVVAAQVANDLLNIKMVKASFVLTYIDGKTCISARSIGDTNVQLIMEKMGGGGHLNMAAAQIDAMEPEEAIKILKTTVKKMIDGGEIV